MKIIQLNFRKPYSSITHAVAFVILPPKRLTFSIGLNLKRIHHVKVSLATNSRALLMVQRQMLKERCTGAAFLPVQ